MHALQDYIDAQFGGPGKGFFRIVKTLGRGAQGDQRRQARRGDRRRGVGGARLRAVQRDAEVRRRPDRPRARPSSTPPASARCSRSTSSTTPSAGPSSTAARRACSSTPATSARPGGSGRPTTATGADHDNTPTSPIGERRRPLSTRCSGRSSTQPLFAGPAAGLPARRRCATRRASPPLGRAPDPRDDAQGHDRRDRPHEREGAPRRRSAILEAAKYPGVISSHSLGRPRQPEAPAEARRAGRADLERGDHVRRRVAHRARQPRHALHCFGTGFGSDINGLHAQPVPRAGRGGQPGALPVQARSTAAA